ncbi:MAG: MMPL family transporter [Phycisphaeraceae bacterium]|nr:MMPL family transporter [Phycisphaeraceae bacterium]
MHEELRNQLLGWWSTRVSRHPRWVLFLAVTMAVLSVVLAVKGIHIGSTIRLGPLQFESDRNKLISDELPWNQRFLDWQNHFLGKDDLVVVIDTQAYPQAPEYPQRLALAKQVAEELAAQLLKPRARGEGQDSPAIPLVTQALFRFDTRTASPKAVRLQSSAAFAISVDRISQGIQEAKPLLASRSLAGFLSNVAVSMKDSSAQQTGNAPLAKWSDSIRQLAQLIAAINADLSAAPDAPPALAKYLDPAAGQDPWEYLSSDNGRLLFMRVRPWRDKDEINAAAWSIAGIRQTLAELLPRYPRIDAGLTGVDVLESDETDSAMRDSAESAVVACVLIGIILVTAFHSWRLPLVLLCSLGFGIIWTFGFATIAVGHLQVISVVFTSILLGLGIAYGAYLASRFEMVRHQYPEGVAGFLPALRDTVQTVGPGVITGALTTAAAFCTTLLTKFRGVAEMGLIAAGGIMLCLLAMFSVYPAFLRLVKPAGSDIQPMHRRVIKFFDDRWIVPFCRRPRITLLAALVLTVVALLPVLSGAMRFDSNLMELMPKNAPSLTWQDRIARDGGNALYYAAAIYQDLDEARQQAQRFRALPTVSDLGGIGLLFPADEADRLDRLANLHAQLQSVLAVAPESPTTLPQTIAPPGAELPGAGLPGVEESLGAMATQLALTRSLGIIPQELLPALDELSQALKATLATLAQLPAEERQTRLAKLDAQLLAARQVIMARLESALDTSPLTMADLPLPLRQTYTDSAGRVVVEIYPKLPDGVQSPLDPRLLPRFVADVYSVNPMATGASVQIYESGKLIKSSYQIAGLLALGFVFLLVLLDFQQVNDTLLTLAPVGVGFALTFGLMWLVGMSINAANIMVLPLMFGIGVDAGVNMIHRYRQAPTTRPLGLSHGTGKGITVTSLTAVVGFGSLVIARHRGIASLGFVMASGILLTMLACWIVVPAWLEIRHARTPQPPDP